MKRRDFLKISGLGLIGFSFGKFNLPAYSMNNENILVIVELKGGNDGLNTVIPFTDQKYYDLRPNISINQDSILRISDKLGLNPSMNNLMNIWNEKDLAIVLGVGYPDPNRSHFRSIEIWETASNSSETLQDGWISRVFDKYPKLKKDIDGIIIGQGDEGPLSGLSMNNLVMNNPEQFIKDSKKVKNIQSITENNSLKHILKIENEIYKSSDLIEKKLQNKANYKHSYPQTNIGKQFESVNNIISNQIPVSIIKIEHGSFDTHINQRNTQDKLLKDLSDALYIFKKNMLSLNKWNNILVMTYSEFGRRASQNGSNGTDHGTSAPHFIMGGKVKGGLYGAQPDLDDLVNGDLKFKVDYRSLYSTISKSWWQTSPDFLVKYPTIDFI